MSPYFSIIIPLFNKENEIVNTLKSVLDQSFQDFEIVLVNDGSTDQSLFKAQSIKDERIYIFSTENKGVSHARNFGIKMAKADYIALLDADDIWFNHHLIDLKNLIEHFPNCGMYCKAYEKDYFRKHTVDAKFYNLPNGFRGIVPDYFENSLVDSIGWTSALAIPQSTLETVGNFDETILSGQDTDLWIRIAVQLPVAFSSQVSVKRCFLEKNHLSKSEKVIERLKVLNKYLELEKTNYSLKKYMDFNRLAFAIEQKSRGNEELFKEMMTFIDRSNLNLKRRILTYLPANFLIKAKMLQKSLVERGLYFSPFR